MKYTFSSLGFDGIANIAKVIVDKDSKTFMPVEVSKKDEPIYKKFLIPTLMKYIQGSEINRKKIGFVAAIAYFMDGHVEYAYNSSDNLQYIVTGGAYEAGFYNSDRCPEGFSSNLEYVGIEFNARNPEGLMLFQEIPGNSKNSYKFRVVHDLPTDNVGEISEKSKIDAHEVRKIALIESAFEYLQKYHGRESFTETEISEIISIMDMVSVLDPKGRYVDKEDERVLGMGTFPLGRKKTENVGKILNFPGNREDK